MQNKQAIFLAYTEPKGNKKPESHDIRLQYYVVMCPTIVGTRT